MNEMRLRPILRALFFCMIGFAHVSTAHAQAAGPQISAVPHMPTMAGAASSYGTHPVRPPMTMGW
jgi:hypothetical protein